MFGQLQSKGGNVWTACSKCRLQSPVDILWHACLKHTAARQRCVDAACLAVHLQARSRHAHPVQAASRTHLQTCRMCPPVTQTFVYVCTAECSSSGPSAKTEAEPQHPPLHAVRTLRAPTACGRCYRGASTVFMLSYTPQHTTDDGTWNATLAETPCQSADWPSARTMSRSVRTCRHPPHVESMASQTREPCAATQRARRQTLHCHRCRST